jgi:hypothetical protein
MHALLLWPLDVAVRRVSVLRSDLALGRAWVGNRWRTWRGPARRPQPVGEMLAAKERAGGRRTRAALRQPPAESVPPPIISAAPAPPAAATPATAAAVADSATGTAAAAKRDTDTMARLRDAKRRARDRG